MNALEQLGTNAAPAQMAFGAGETVISGYFAGQMAGMLLSGYRARTMGRKLSQKNHSLQQELNDIRLEFNKNKSQAEIEFLKECHETGMAFQRDSAKQSCMDRRQEEEFRKFCESSWLSHYRPDISSILEAMNNPNLDDKGVVKIKLLIARTPLVAIGADRKGAYTDFCEEFKNEYLRMFNLSIDTTWLRAWERDCVSPIADTMNLHYIMQGIPTMILYPIQRGNMLSLESATWGYQLGQTGLVFDKTFRVPMTEIETNPERLNKILLAASAYIDDCYRVWLCQSAPDSLYKVKEYLHQDEFVWSLLNNKYRALIESTQKMADLLLLDSKEVDKLKTTMQQ